MRTWELASVAFFAYIALVAVAMYASGWLRVGLLADRTREPGEVELTRGRTFRILLAAATGIVAPLISSRLPHSIVLHDWLLPPMLLLVAYWTSGMLFVAPMRRVEAAFLALDDRLRIGRLAAGSPRWVAELLEAAYVGVYPLIPIALGVHLLFAAAPDAGRFWSVILITDYVCFGALPWLQTRPPRGIESGEPWRSTIRAFNLRIAGSASIGVNTFPSGHAAEALAAALLVLDAPLPIVIVMFLNALAISAGAVLGRYHYAADALSGWVVALAVWFAMRAGGAAL